MENRTNPKRVVILFSVTFLFIFLFLAFASAERIETVQFQGQINLDPYLPSQIQKHKFNEDGTQLYVLVYNQIYQFSVPDPFNVTAALVTFNNTLFNFSSPETAQSFDIANGSDLYIGTQGSGTSNSKILHYKVTAGNITTAALVGAENTSLGTTAVWEIYASEAGDRMIITNWIDNSVGWKIYGYSMTNYNLSTLSSTGITSTFGTSSLAQTCFDVTNSGTKLYLLQCNPQAFTTESIVEYNMTSAYNVTTIFEVGSLGSSSFRTVTAQNLGIQFTDGSALYGYAFNLTQAAAPSSGAGAAGGFADAFALIYPASETLSSKQKMSYVLSLMFLTALAFLLGGYFSGNWELLMPVMLFLLIVEFLYFVVIGYIPVGTLIILVLVFLAIVVMRFRS